MKFDTPASGNPIDQPKVVGKPFDHIDGPLKPSGLARYAYEQHDVVPHQAYGYIVGSAIAKDCIASMDMKAALAAPGVLAAVNAQNACKLGKGKANGVKLLAGPGIDHYHQAVALVVAETFEQARAAAQLLKVEYVVTRGSFDLASSRTNATLPKSGRPESAFGNFAGAYPDAPVRLDDSYSTPDHTHAMMEPFASMAAWEGDKVTVWISNQMIA